MNTPTDMSVSSSDDGRDRNATMTYKNDTTVTCPSCGRHTAINHVEEWSDGFRYTELYCPECGYIEPQKQANDEDMEGLVVLGHGRGRYSGKLVRNFSGELIVVLKHDGTVLIHSASSGILPVCYIQKTKHASVERNFENMEVEIMASNDVGESVNLLLDTTYSMTGVPENKTPEMIRNLIPTIKNKDTPELLDALEKLVELDTTSLTDAISSDEHDAALEAARQAIANAKEVSQ